MTRLLLLSALLLFAGTTVLFGEVRWFARPRLTDRLRRFAPASTPTAGRAALLTAASFRDVAAPLAQSVGDAIARLLGVEEDLRLRLQRLHSPLDPASFRVRQIGAAGAALGLSALVTLTMAMPPVLALLLLGGGPLLVVLLAEQRLLTACRRRQEQLFHELPVVAEQLGMLLGAGYSLTASISRLARRSHGAAAADLLRVGNRVRQGLSESDALLEWASIARVREVDRLVDVLVLDRQGADLAQLVAQEARAMRGEAHRRTLEQIERRNQLVWVPVTVATLVPGVLFIAIPFIAALREFAAL